ncbi:hypothetical protein H4219_006274 [Mycoemilia scoparia]|uniref:Uncharacterized protein n=1 Tax=Mycoemilia scoparia TaxID=417184 RepID=A0A9W7ZTH7_9FUNG|nr:hypothetical protein H4219_006274 [Mycoemilia scoparia]
MSGNSKLSNLVRPLPPVIAWSHEDIMKYYQFIEVTADNEWRYFEGNVSKVFGVYFNEHGYVYSVRWV